MYSNYSNSGIQGQKESCSTEWTTLTPRIPLFFSLGKTPINNNTNQSINNLFVAMYQVISLYQTGSFLVRSAGCHICKHLVM